MYVYTDNGFPMTDLAPGFEQRLGVLDAKNLLTRMDIPGSHHLHLDEDTSTLCAQTIVEYLCA